MSQTAIQTSLNPRPDPPEPPLLRPAPNAVWELVMLILRAVASLRLTVVLFALSMFLVFCGTLAQVEMGLWTAMDEYFRSWGIIWIPFQLFVKFGQIFLGLPPSWEVAGSFPFPGGWLLGGLLLVNLLAAHIVRFRLTWKRSGILLIHAGLIIMMLSELITGLFAVEANMTIAEGETVNFTDVSREIELAIIDPSNPKFDDVVVIPGSLLEKGGLIQSDELPVDVEVLEYMENSRLIEAEKVPDAGGATFVSAVNVPFKLIPRSEESGTSSQADAPAVRVRFLKKGTDKVLGERVLSLWFYPNFTRRIPYYKFPPQHLAVGDKRYTVELRPRRVYKPYAIHLIDFRFDRYIGTEVPKNYSSQVVLSDPARNESRELKISMNDPLRHAGETFYQSAFTPDEKGTVLQVVHNPGWLMPYISCVIVAVGMLIHFGLHLTEFLRRRAAL